MLDRKEIIHRNLEKLRIIKIALEELLRISQSTIKSLSWYNKRITGNKQDFSFAERLYGSISEDDIEHIPESVFPIFINPLQKLVSLGNDYQDIKDHLQSIHDKMGALSGPIASSTSLVSNATGYTAANIVSLGSQVSFTSIDVNQLVKEYLSQKEVNDEIEYIKLQLPKIVPDISADYLHFLENYYGSEPSAAKFQELIGCRSMIYFKLIYPIAEIYGASRPASTRRQQIAKFVYGRTTAIDTSAEKTIDMTKELWDDLSDQDPSGQSVKTGNVTPEYIEIMFNKVITTLFTLLRQRELLFVP